ncbi:DM13 domain-containing protein [Streptomyces sp. NBC_00237]|uniref:DM13 domain-containing protein n=1 Tax=Streptomyces sp. NBC_00237 TaxID=2975687 RepID=UPI0022550469|nr:DM13 domain-containing protein [Streptomyces sp. NBC_00237]MCX5205410.1 DM13 domain-containing protein [Streptomyces sp. NBC_00237]
MPALGLSRRTIVILLVALVVVAGGALYAFQPWKAFTTTTVDETLPSASAPATPGTPSTPPPGAAGPVDLARGSFVSHEHATSGTARTVRLADGKQSVLRLEDLATSEGPDVRVYLSPRDARSAEKGLGEGAVQLGKLKGNRGNQNYSVPAGTDLSAFRSAVIWCERFSVSFGAADLTPA